MTFARGSARATPCLNAADHACRLRRLLTGHDGDHVRVSGRLRAGPHQARQAHRPAAPAPPSRSGSPVALRLLPRAGAPASRGVDERATRSPKPRPPRSDRARPFSAQREQDEVEVDRQRAGWRRARLRDGVKSSSMLDRAALGVAVLTQVRRGRPRARGGATRRTAPQPGCPEPPARPAWSK